MTLNKQELEGLVKLIGDASKDSPYVGALYKKYGRKLSEKGDLLNFSKDLAGEYRKDSKKPKKVVDIIRYITDSLKKKPKTPINSCQPPLPPGKYTFKDIAGQEKLKEDMQINYIYPFQYPLT